MFRWRFLVNPGGVRAATVNDVSNSERNQASRTCVVALTLRLDFDVRLRLETSWKLAGGATEKLQKDSPATHLTSTASLQNKERGIHRSQASHSHS